MMKIRFLVVVVILALLSPTTGFTSEEEVLAEIVVRPLGFVGLVVGSALFLVTLPVSVVVGGTDRMAETLVNKPYRFTFERDMGEGLKDRAYPSEP